MALLVFSIAGGAGWAVAQRSPKSEGKSAIFPRAFGEVMRTDLQETTEVPGRVAYASNRTVVSRLATPEGGATLTGIATQGTIVRRGERLFSINATPVVLMLGATPAWRTLEVGVSGRDVGQLKRNLKALGYRGFKIDDRFTLETAAAVRRWQRDVRAPRDGVVDLGEVVFLPGDVRIQQDLRTVGDPVSSGEDVLAVGPTTPVVTADLKDTQLSQVAVGARVIVRLANRKEVPGIVSAVGGENQQQQQQGSEGQGIPATISLVDPADAAGLVGSSATVKVIIDTRKAVLAVPVTALLAVQGGGYVVEADRGTRIVAVPVTPGLFDARGLVEVTADGLKAGDRVVVAGA